MYVYVLNANGQPLMPTCRFRHVRHMLKNKLAVVVKKRPFTVRLLYETEDITQPLVLGIDPGRQNIGLAVTNLKAEPVYSAKVETRNKDIPKLMEGRRAFRQIRRQLKRQKRRRRARASGNVKAEVFERILPCYETPIVCHDIRNKESRFNNRKRPAEWLTPTANHLLSTHLSLISKVRQILPITDISLEVNRFAFMAMENPGTSGIDFQNGPLKGYDNVNLAVNALQHGRCLMCNSPIVYHHHIIPKHEGGSDTIDNIAGLCSKCHDRVHKDKSFAKELRSKKSGLVKRYEHLSVLNQIVPYLWKAIANTPGITTHATDGYETSCMRQLVGLDKDHDLDAYVIACNGAGIEPVASDIQYYSIRQYRRHNRAAMHNANFNRVYLLDGKKAATNRHKATEQKEPALADISLSKAKVSKLTVKPHPATYKTPKEYTQGSIFRHNGREYVLQGYYGTRKDRYNNTISRYCVGTNGDKHSFVKSRFIYHNTGLVYLL